MRVISVVPSRGSRSSNDYDSLGRTKTARRIKKGRSSPPPLTQPPPGNNWKRGFAIYRQQQQQQKERTDANATPTAPSESPECFPDETSHSSHGDEDRYQDHDNERRHRTRREEDISEREAPAPTSRHRSSKRREDSHLKSRRSSKHDDDDDEDEEKEQQSHSRRPFTSASTFPNADEQYRRHASRTLTFPTMQRTLECGTRKIPKEKRATTSRQLHRADSGKSEASSTDGYLKNCAAFGKYQVDKHSLVQPKVRGNEEEKERYSTRSPPLKCDSDLSSVIAKWRSEDEDDEEDSEPDWDPSPMDRVLSKFRPTNPTDDETDTLESLEMLAFDGNKVQVLTEAHRYDHTNYDDYLLFQRSNSLEVADIFQIDSLLKKAEKDTKKSKKTTTTKKKSKKNDKNTTKKDKKSKKPKLTSSPEREPRENNDELELQHKRTLSTISNSVPFAAEAGHGTRRKVANRSKRWHRDEEDSLSDDDQYGSASSYESESGSYSEDEDEYDYDSDSSGSLSSGEQRAFRQQKREEHRRWLAKREKERAKKGRGAYFESESEAESLESDSDDWDGYEEEDRVKAQKVRSRRRERSKGSRSSQSERNSKDETNFWETVKNSVLLFRRSKSGKKNQAKKDGATEREEADDHLQKLLSWEEPNTEKKGAGKEIKNKTDAGDNRDESDEEESLSELLPWEKPSAEKGVEKVEVKLKEGLLRRLSSKVRPQKEAAKVKSVTDDLPFPKSDSMDGSLADVDKYKDIFDGLPVLSPPGPPQRTLSESAKYRQSPKQTSLPNRIPNPLPGAPDSAATVSSMSCTLPDKKRPLAWRAKKGLGSKVKSIFLKPY